MSNTRIFHVFQRIVLQIQKKSFLFQDIFTVALIFLFSGFSFGNLFGTFLSEIRHLNLWDGFIIFLILLGVEVINFLNYRKKNLKSNLDPMVLESNGKIPLAFSTLKYDLRVANLRFATKELRLGPHIKRFERTSGLRPNKIIQILNYFKIGLLFGFFVDAFKVGS